MRVCDGNGVTGFCCVWLSVCVCVCVCERERERERERAGNFVIGRVYDIIIDHHTQQTAELPLAGLRKNLLPSGSETD